MSSGPIYEESLSISQANKLVAQANEALQNCKTKIEDKLNTFLLEMSKIWEDNNAVDLSVQMNEHYQYILTTMTDNNAKFAKNLEFITTLYTAVGAIPEKLSEQPYKFSGELNYKVVQPFFKGSNNSDDFGFIDAKTGPQRVADSLTLLKQDLENITTNLVTALDKIKAFGNTNVKMEVTKSAGRIVEVLTQIIDAFMTIAYQKLHETAKNYMGVAVVSTELLHGIAKTTNNSVNNPEIK